MKTDAEILRTADIIGAGMMPANFDADVFNLVADMTATWLDENREWVVVVMSDRITDEQLRRAMLAQIINEGSK
jgi:hypothetical protein